MQKSHSDSNSDVNLITMSKSYFSCAFPLLRSCLRVDLTFHQNILRADLFPMLWCFSEIEKLDWQWNKYNYCNKTVVIKIKWNLPRWLKRFFWGPQFAKRQTQFLLRVLTFLINSLFLNSCAIFGRESEICSLLSRVSTWGVWWGRVYWCKKNRELLFIENARGFISIFNIICC